MMKLNYTFSLREKVGMRGMSMKSGLASIAIHAEYGFQRADHRRATSSNHMCVYFGGFDIAMAQLRLNSSNIIYMDVVYAGFAGAKTGPLRVLVSGSRKNGVACGNWQVD